MICSRPDVVRVSLSEYQHFFHVSAILLVANHVCCIAIATFQFFLTVVEVCYNT